MTTPTGVVMASATQLTIECVTWMNSTLNGPISTMSFGLTARSIGIFVHRVLFETPLDQRKRERGPVDRHVELGEEESDRADMVLVTVRQQQRAHMLAVLFEERQIRRDDVHAEQFGFGKHHSGVDHDDVVAVPEGHHVHPELAQSAERDDLQFFI